jgi:hypothetical protein
MSLNCHPRLAVVMPQGYTKLTPASDRDYRAHLARSAAETGLQRCIGEECRVVKSDHRGKEKEGKKDDW